MTKTIFCVKDNRDSLESLQVLLETEGYKAVPYETSEEALSLPREDRFSAIILDHWLAPICGIDICWKIRTYNRKTLIIFYSGAARSEDKKMKMEPAAQDYLVKPNDFNKITEAISQLNTNCRNGVLYP